MASDGGGEGYRMWLGGGRVSECGLGKGGGLQNVVVVGLEGGGRGGWST